MITGEPGTDAQVINTGTETDAIFDFIIPRGEPGAGGPPEVLATVDSTPQQSTTGGALIFGETPLVSGYAITHQAGAPDVQILQSGIYQATFQGTVSVYGSPSIPATATVELYLNGTPVPGAIASHTFTSSNETTTRFFSVPFRVDAPPSTLEVVVNDSGFTFDNIALTVLRLGESF